MGRYVRPAVIVSYTVEELRADAASCMTYVPGVPSDRNLKADIKTLYTD